MQMQIVVVHVYIATADRRRVPPHWVSVRARNSPLSHEAAARHAMDPTNAILNYAHAILEGQTRQALSVAGFDLAWASCTPIAAEEMRWSMT
jgi:hypothetical protein